MFIVLDLPHSACPYKAIILFMIDKVLFVLPDGIEPYRLLDHLCRQRVVIFSVVHHASRYTPQNTCLCRSVLLHASDSLKVLLSFVVVKFSTFPVILILPAMRNL